MARVKTVKRAQKDQGNCLKCGTEIKAGMSYRYFKRYRQRTKNLFCMKAECTPTAADTDNSKMRTVYEAQGSALAILETATEMHEIEEALEEVAAAAEEVSYEYAEAIQNAPMLESRYQERVDALEEWANALRDVDTEEYEEDDTLSKEENEDQKAEAFDTALETARDLIENVPE